jgi:hypothetical protein
MLKLKVNRPLGFSIQFFEKGAALVLALFFTDRFGAWDPGVGKLGPLPNPAHSADATTQLLVLKV